jgi:hypothetical protein
MKKLFLTGWMALAILRSPGGAAEASPFLVADVNQAGVGETDPQLMAAGGRLFFSAEDPEHG